ncbi:MAG: hypothetical protein Q7U04_00805 [Bacteriovorax sp.]|nr:hypothetical protein [Bacteriovorax sp.]
MAQTNLAVLETYLKDIIISEETILTMVENREHIFEIKDEEKTLGFISLYDLKAYISEHEEDAQNYWVKNIDLDEWKHIFEHPFFQRRKPQLITPALTSDPDDLDFFVLTKGQKTGPLKKLELMEKVENKEILLSDMVSYNAGMTWIKLYQVDGFERRTLMDNDQLPGMPSNDFLKKPSESINTMSETTDAISSLAFLGNQKKGKTLEREREVSYQDELDRKGGSFSIYKWLLLASVAGIMYFLFNIKSHLNSPFGAQPGSTVGEQAEMLTPTEIPTNSENKTNSRQNLYPTNSGVNDQRRMGKFETRQMNPVRPSGARKSFMETQKYQESNTPSEDSNYYYDNATPMELDPVRSQITKENFENGGEPAAPPDADPLYSGEVSN